MSDIITEITEKASSLEEKDLDLWVVPKLMEYFGPKIPWLASKAYLEAGGTQQLSQVAVAAFKQAAQSEVRTAAHTFVFKSQHWKTNREIAPYLWTCLNRLSDRLRWESGSLKKINIPVCPACRIENRKEYLLPEGKFWKCQECSKNSEILAKQISLLKTEKNFKEVSKLEPKLRLCKMFALHSRKGYRCPDCSRFIPETANTAFGISCPFDNCIFMGKLDGLEIMPHPVALSFRNNVSLNESISKDEPGSLILQDRLEETNNIGADVQLDVAEQNEIEYETLLQVIEDQIELIYRMNTPATMVQKLLMYEAFKIMIDRFPEEMVSYLVHRKQNQDFSVQVRIFQTYVSLVENYLPFSIEKNGSTIDIVSLTDPNLNLFLGESVFEAKVEKGFVIPNQTKETYTGGRKFKAYGSCFIGKLINVFDKATGNSIIDHVKEYSFIQIQLDESIPIGTEVIVKHYRIPPHYEMLSLVWLQRIRKSVVDKIYLRLNKKKRIPGQ